MESEQVKSPPCFNQEIKKDIASSLPQFSLTPQLQGRKLDKDMYTLKQQQRQSSSNLVGERLRPSSALNVINYF